MPKIVHFEIPADNTERARQFYGKLFGWIFDKAPSGDLLYWMIIPRKVASAAVYWSARIPTTGPPTTSPSSPSTTR